MASASRFWSRPGLYLVAQLHNKTRRSRPGRGQNLEADSFEAEAKILASRPKFWPRGLNITGPFSVTLSPRGQSGLQTKILASASKLWPRPQGFDLGLVSIFLSYYVIGHFSCKNRVKFGNFVNFSSNNLKSYVVNHYLVFFIIIFGLGLELIVVASALKLWPRPRGFGLGLASCLIM